MKLMLAINPPKILAHLRGMFTRALHDAGNACMPGHPIIPRLR